MMPIISSNAMAHMGFLQEGSPPFHYILLRKPLKSARVARGGQGPSDSSAAARHRRYPGR